MLTEKEIRINKAEKMRELGINPYPAKADRTHSVKEVLDNFENLSSEKKEIVLAGRIRSIRLHGKLIFVDIEDESGEIQIFLRQDEVDANAEEWKKLNVPCRDTKHRAPTLDTKFCVPTNAITPFKFFKEFFDTGDFIEVYGSLFETKQEEKTLLVSNFRMLAKALISIPTEHFGIKDEEDRLRKRYLDILCNPEVKEMFYKRAKFWNSVRDFLMDKGFLEVETPVLENTTGGGDARPFMTHHNALDLDVYLRISMGELWQKRLMVSGFEKTYEIGRQFRNEGMDAEHLQDYTQMEFYWAYADYKMGMDLAEEMFKDVIEKTFGTLKFKIRGFDIDLNKKWESYDYQETVKKFTGIDILNTDLERIENKLKELKVAYDKNGFNITRGIDNLWKYCRRQIAGPGFLINEPIEVSPLAKKDDKNPKVVQRYHVIIAGSELANGYSELNDPIEQAERFFQQAELREAGDEEAQMNDSEFVEALEYGMPPTTGLGFSERVFSFFMDKPLRECQIFPLMRPRITHKAEIQAKCKIKMPDLGIDLRQAQDLLDKYIKDPITKLHCRESEVIMRKLAKHFKEDEEKWGIVGLLHDIDWELTKDDTSQHCVKAVEILKETGASDFLIETIVSHCYGHNLNEDLKDKKRSTRAQHCLASAETLTGLIIATALVRPDKKLASVELSSLKKKFKTKGFAANCNREMILECEQAGIALDEFLEIGLKALQEIAGELGM